jgi:heme/copper-type cytochrome/quinol oxidase subunit 2
MENIQSNLIKKWNKKAIYSFVALILMFLTYAKGGIAIDIISNLNYSLRWIPLTIVGLLFFLSFYLGVKSQMKYARQLHKGNVIGLIPLIITSLLILLMIVFNSLFFAVFLMGFPTTSSW